MLTKLPKKIIDALPKQFSYTQQMGLGEPPRPIVPENATPIRSTEMGRNIIGYEIPLEKPADYPETDALGFPVPPLVAKYDVNGKLLKIESQQRYFADNEYHIQPQYSATGEFITDSASTNAANSGSLFGDIKRDFGPMILAAIAGNAATGNLGTLFGGGGAGAAVTGASTGGTALTAAELAAGSSANFMSPAVISAAGGAGGVGTGAAIASQIATQGATPSLLQQAASFLNVKPETLASFAPSAIQGLLSAGGSYLQSEQAKEAAETQANAQIRAAQIAADAARFRPVGVTTRFGSSNFTTDAAGNVTGAGYTPSAEITGYQDRLRTVAGQGMTDIEGARAAYQPLTGAAQSLFGLGQGYLAKTPEQAAQDYISKQQALLTPSRENQLAELRNRQFQTGRGGAATAQGGSLINTNPEMAAYYNSLAQQDLVLAAQADQEARNRITYGAGLFDTGANLQGRFYTGQTGAYAPFATAMDTSATLERLAERPLTLGTEIGARTTAGTAAGGRFLSEGITSAAQTMAPANAYSLGGNLFAGAASSPNVTGALNRAFGVTPQPTQQQYTFDPVTKQYVPVQQSVFS